MAERLPKHTKMPLYTHHHLPLSRLKKLSAVVTLLFALPLSVHAAGLGKLTVLSSLGQPLRAEIELTSTNQAEQASLVAKLASADAFRKANIDVNPVLSTLRFEILQRGGMPFIRITSTQAINEPFVDMLLELSGSSRQVREYTFLLDPPEMHKPQTAQVAPSAPAVVAAEPAKMPAAAEIKPTEQKTIEAKPATSSKPMAIPAQAVATGHLDDEEPAPKIIVKSAPSSLAEELIRTGRSDNSKVSNAPVSPAVAEKTVPAPTTPGAMTAAKGSKSKTPAEKSTDSKSYRVKDGDTLGQIAGRTKDNSVSLDQMLVALYRANPDAFIGDNMNRLRAGHVLTLPAASDANTQGQAEAHATVVAQAQDFNSYRNKLAGQVASGAATMSSESKHSGGGKVTARVQEKTVGSEAQDKLQLSKAGVGAGEKAAIEEKIAADKALAEANERVKELEKNVSDLQKLLEIKNKTLTDLSAQQKSPVTPPTAAVSAPPVVAPAAETKPATQAAEAAAPEAVAPTPAPVEALKPPPMVPVPTPIAKPGFFDHLKDNPFAIPAAGLLVALLAGLGFVRVRNKKKAAVPAASGATQVPETNADDEPVEAHQAVAEPLDPLVEADQYIAYGRDEQAEEVLRQAMQKEPERQAIPLKLLEIYYKRRDVAAFNGIARQLHKVSGGIGVDWTEAATMGVVLDPNNPLYAEAAVEEMMPAIEVAVPSKAVAAAPPPPVEKAPEPEPDAGLEFDLSDFKAAEMPTSATQLDDIGSKIDFDLELDSGTKTVDKEVAVPEKAPAPPPAPAPAPIELEMPEPPAASTSLGVEDDESAFATEMATKLDLAEAYQEIGDKDGALELLEEVIRGGSDSQIERAKDMLSKLK